MLKWRSYILIRARCNHAAVDKVRHNDIVRKPFIGSFISHNNILGKPPKHAARRRLERALPMLPETATTLSTYLHSLSLIKLLMKTTSFEPTALV